MKKQKYAIIVAGGSGSRMGSEIPKQFLPLAGKPILLHTIKRFLEVPSIKIILVLPEKDIEFWNETCIQNAFIEKSIIVVKGGNTRFQSVKNGLSYVEDEGIVAVHDGVRPFVSLAIIHRSFEIAEKEGSAITSVVLKDSIREIKPNGENKAVERINFRLMQTPQTFQSELIQKAFEVKEQTFFTDCASVVEFAGFPVTLIEGAYENIKITTPEDLLIAEALLKK